MVPGYGRTARSNQKILIIGPGGAGKSTLGKILSGEYDLLMDLPGKYEESQDPESQRLQGDPGVELVVLPGQLHRQKATWSEPLAGVGAGDYRGIIVVAPYGCDSLGPLSYKKHPLYAKNKEAFLKALLAQNRAAELDVIRQLVRHAKGNKKKLWLLTLVSKQDLWWGEADKVEKHYREGEYGTALQELMSHRGANSSARSTFLPRW